MQILQKYFLLRLKDFIMAYLIPSKIGFRPHTIAKDKRVK